MRTVTTVTRKFEAGDIIVHTIYYWVAIRVAGSNLWKNTNQDYHSAFTDEEVNRYLDSEQWVYVDNHKKFSKIENW